MCVVREEIRCNCMSFSFDSAFFARTYLIHPHLESYRQSALYYDLARFGFTSTPARQD